MATPWVFLSLPGGFIFSALLTLHYGIGPGAFGLIASLPAWSNALQVILVPLLGRFMAARDMALSMSWLNLGVWALLASCLSFLPEGDATLVGKVFIVFFLLSSLSASLVGVGWTSWVPEWVPQRVRGKYFGRRNRYIGMATIAFLIFAMITLKFFGEHVEAYQIILLVAVLARFFSILWTHRIISTPSAPLGSVVHQSWWKHTRTLRGDRNFMLMVTFGAFSGFWLNFMGPFAPVYVYEHLHWSPAAFASLNILATLGGAIMMPIWGKLIDRRSCVFVMTLCLILWQTQNYVWVALNPANSWLLFPMWAWGGLVSSGFLLGTFNLLLKLLPREAKTTGVSINLAITSIAAGIAPILAGWALKSAPGLGWDVVTCYRIGFAVSPTMILLSLLILRHVNEPQPPARELGLYGASRTFRQIMQLQGLAFLANSTLFSRWRKNTANNRPRDRQDSEKK